MKSTTLPVGPSPEGADQPQNTGSVGSLIEAVDQTSTKENRKNSAFALTENVEIARAKAVQPSRLPAFKPATDHRTSRYYRPLPIVQMPL